MRFFVQRVVQSRCVALGIVLAFVFSPMGASGLGLRGQFQKIFRDELSAVQMNMNQHKSTTDVLLATAGLESWFFRRVYFRVRAIVGLSIPLLAEFKVTPDIEFVWERPIPGGWREYRPQR